MHRFFAPALDPGDESVALPRGEAEHLTRVLRLGVGAQRAMAERDEADAEALRGAPFRLCPSAFRPDEQRRIRRHRLPLQCRQRVDPVRRARRPGLHEHQSQRRRRLVEKGLERERHADVRQRRAPRLFHRCERDTPPAIDARRLDEGRHRRLAACGDDRLNRGDAQHHRVADDVIHLVAFERRLDERQGDRRLRRRLDP